MRRKQVVGEGRRWVGEGRRGVGKRRKGVGEGRKDPPLPGRPRTMAFDGATDATGTNVTACRPNPYSY